MAGVFGFGKVAPRPVKTDHVVPLCPFDNSSMIRRIMVGWTARFDDVLDAEILYQALEKLIARDGWRKLGGRLRMNANGKLEVHIPQEFTPSRPAVRLTRAVFDIGIDEHPLACRLPRARDQASVQAGPTELTALLFSADAPTCIDDFLYTDEPLLRLHVVSFADATLVSMLAPHSLCDAMAHAGIVRGWVEVLHGREASVQRFAGGQPHDPLAQAVKAKSVPTVRWIMQDKVPTGLRFVLFVVYLILDIVLGPKMQARTLFFPASAVAKMREESLARIANDHNDHKDHNDHNNSSPAPFVSKGDVLTAWIAKMAATPIAVKSPRQGLVILNTVDLRTRLPSTLDPDVMYGQNLVMTSFALTTLGEAARAPLGHVAAAVRRALVEQTSEEQATAFARLVYAPGSSDSLACDASDTYVFAFTSWAKARFHQAMDFSPAVLRDQDTTAGRKAGKPVLFLSASTNMTLLARYLVNIVGEDEAGNFWAVVWLPASSIGAIEEGMRRL